MRILLILGAQFTEEMLYKENYFIRANVEKGHKILILSVNKKYVNGNLVNVPENEYDLNENVHVIRKAFKSIGPRKLSDKIKITQNFMQHIRNFSPDIIFFYSFPMYDLLKLKQIKNEFPDTKIYADSSATKENSARGIMSQYILHKWIYRSWVRQSLDNIDCIYYVIPEVREFLEIMYKIPSDKMEFRPLPSKVLGNNEKVKSRQLFLETHDLNKDNIIFVHAGKMDRKKLTIEILDKFVKARDDRFKLYLAGSFSDDIKDEVEKYLNLDSRICYMGFLSGEELTRVLAAADLYIQPGSVSQIAQTALGCSTPIAVPKDYEIFYNNNGFILNSVNDLEEVFRQVSDNPEILKEMSVNAGATAREMLDYKNLAL